MGREGRGRGGGGGGGEACEQSVISGCSGLRRKRELGIAAPSPFTYFLSPRAPALAPARGRGRGRRRQPPGSARPSPRGGAGPRAPGAPAPSSSPRAAVPLGTDSGAGPRSRPWRRPGLGHSGTRSSPGAPAADPPPASASAAGGGAGSPRKPGPRPPPTAAPGDPAEPSALPAHAARGISDHPDSPEEAAPPPRGFRQLGPPPAVRLHGFPDVQPQQAPAPDAQPHGLRLPPLHAAPASRGPAPPAHLPRLAAGSRFPPSHRRGGSMSPLKGPRKAATCLLPGWGVPSTRLRGQFSVLPRRSRAGVPSLAPTPRAPPPAPSYLLSSPGPASLRSDPRDGEPPSSPVDTPQMLK